MITFFFNKEKNHERTFEPKDNNRQQEEWYKNEDKKEWIAIKAIWDWSRKTALSKNRGIYRHIQSVGAQCLKAEH